MDASRTALVQGWTDTRTTLVDWNAKPGRVVGAWLAASAVIGVGLLMAVWAIAGVSMPDPSALLRPGSGRVGTLGDAWRIVARNCLVLALHAMACVAGFIAGSSLPLQAATQSGRVRWIHERAGPLAIAFVIAATGFSLVTQAWVLGAGTSTLAAQLHTSPGVLLLALSPMPSSSSPPCSSPSPPGSPRAVATPGTSSWPPPSPPSGWRCPCSSSPPSSRCSYHPTSSAS